jgi:hypothetical protein
VIDDKKKEGGFENLKDLRKKEQKMQKEKLGKKEEKDIAAEEEAKTFIKITRLNVMRRQMATKRDIEEVYKKID